MKRIEKLAIVLIVVGLLQAPVLWGLFHYMPTLLRSGGRGLSLFQEALGMATTAGMFLVSAVCAVWLYLEAERHGYSKWVWALLGLTFKLPALAIFYGVVILATLKKNGNANQQSDGIHR